MACKCSVCGQLVPTKFTIQVNYKKICTDCQLRAQEALRPMEAMGQREYTYREMLKDAVTAEP